MTEFEKELLAKLEQLQAQNMKLQAELLEIKGQQAKKPTAAQKKKAAAPKGKAARAITQEEYTELIDTMREGGVNFEPSDRNATIFVLQANLGLRLGDLLNLTPSSFVRDGSRWRLNIIEEKTGKVRNFTVPAEIMQYIESYCYRNNIGQAERIFPVTTRAIQKYLVKVVDYLDLPGNVTSHSFRKFFATSIYTKSGYNIALVQELLQHASAATTQKYVGIRSEAVESAIQSNVNLR